MPPADLPARLDRQAVVAAGCRLVERVGVKALTMQLLADDLGVSSMAAYRHVPSKSDLLLLIANEVMSRIMVPVPGSASWDVRLQALETNAFRELSRTPDLWSVIPPDAVYPEQERLSRAVIDLLLEAGFDRDTASLAYEAIFGYVFGQLRLRLQLDARRRELSPDFSGRTERKVLLGHEGELDQGEALEFERYFDYGLRILIDGLRMDLDGRRSWGGKM